MRVSIRQNCAVGTYRKCLKKSVIATVCLNGTPGIFAKDSAAVHVSRVTIIPHSRNYTRNGYKLSVQAFWVGKRYL